jgi:hypothetical protein
MRVVVMVVRGLAFAVLGLERGAALAKAAKQRNLVGCHPAPGLAEGVAELFALARGEMRQGVGLSPEHVEGRAFAGEIEGDHRV